MTKLLALLILALPVTGQRIETELADRSEVKHLETVIDHLTVLEFTEPVTMAAAGSPAFKIERHANKVFIQPLEPGASTNLFIWTASARFTYELQPAASVEEAHFAIDEARPVREVTIETPVEPSADDLAAEIVMRGMPVRGVDLDSGESEVRVVVTDMLERDGKLLLRYTIDNRSRRPYVPGVPAVVRLSEPRSPISLFVWRYSQVGSDIAEEIGDAGRRPVQVAERGQALEVVNPGGRKSGLIALDLTLEDSEPTVVELSFPSNDAAPITVTLVL